MKRVEAKLHGKNPLNLPAFIKERPIWCSRDQKSPRLFKPKRHVVAFREVKGAGLGE